MSECNIDKNKKMCNCTYTSCSRHGVCCECIAYHRSKDQLPACYFPDDVEKTYDRSIERYIQVWQNR